MNIIYTLPCGCHRGLCECPVATDLHRDMLTARTQAELVSVESLEEWRVYDQCYQAYTAHIEQQQEVSHARCRSDR